MSDLDDTLSAALDATTRPHLLVQLLQNRAKLPPATIGRACGVGNTTVRAWALMDRRPTDASYQRLRYLADVVGVLAGFLSPRGINQWLTGPSTRLGAPPLSLLAQPIDSAERVLSAAEWLASDGVV